MHKPEYSEIFDFRGDSYNKASERFPHAREQERRQLLNLLQSSEGKDFCDIPAGGGYLANGLLADQDAIAVTCVEPSSSFASVIDPRCAIVHSPIDQIPLADEQFDAIGSLAGLHHIEDRTKVFKEWTRLLKSHGLLAVADVQTGSKTDAFLNQFVDQYTPQGHDGLFFKPGEFTHLMQQQGLQVISEELVDIVWTFETQQHAAEFCQALFYLQGISEADLIAALDELLGLSHNKQSGQWELNWTLCYALGKK